MNYTNTSIYTIFIEIFRLEFAYNSKAAGALTVQDRVMRIFLHETSCNYLPNKINCRPIALLVWPGWPIQNDVSAIFSEKYNFFEN